MENWNFAPWNLWTLYGVNVFYTTLKLYNVTLTYEYLKKKEGKSLLSYSETESCAILKSLFPIDSVNVCLS